MFQNKELLNYIETSSSVKTKSLVIAEWNMNIATNISTIGNYRYRPTQAASPYRTIPNTFDPLDSGSAGIKYYTGATDADVIIDGGFDDDGDPTTLKPIK